MSEITQIRVGDKLPNFHCPGHDVEVVAVLPGPAPDSIYWFCENPDCSLVAEDDRYRNGGGSGVYSDAVAWQASGTTLPLEAWWDEPTPEGRPAWS